MKRAVYSIPVLGMALVGCGDGERVDDPIVANFAVTLYDGTALPYTYSYTDPATNVTCTLSYSAVMEVTDGLKALVEIYQTQECDDGSLNATYTEGLLGDVTIVASGAQYTIAFGSDEFSTLLTCTMDAATALQCTDQNAAAWAFQLAQ
jgi:hypothetical protein